VPIFQDATLARALSEVAEGDEIPVRLYDEVAEVLGVVYGAALFAPAAGAENWSARRWDRIKSRR
jgi:flagellar biosynthesis protein FlhB